MTKEPHENTYVYMYIYSNNDNSYIDSILMEKRSYRELVFKLIIVVRGTHIKCMGRSEDNSVESVPASTVIWVTTQN